MAGKMFFPASRTTREAERQSEKTRVSSPETKLGRKSLSKVNSHFVSKNVKEIFRKKKYLSTDVHLIVDVPSKEGSKVGDESPSVHTTQTEPLHNSKRTEEKGGSELEERLRHDRND